MEGGRKRKKLSKRETVKKMKYSSQGKKWEISCPHDENSKICGIRSLSEDETVIFFNNLYKNETKSD